MTSEPSEILPPERDLALAHTPAKVRDALRIFLWLDLRLGRIVSQASEPMLAQVRLAWWRDMLGTSAEDRPRGDAVLDGISLHWQGRQDALVACVDGWERLLDEPPLSSDAAQEFAAGRARSFVATAVPGAGDRARLAIELAGTRWALVDAALRFEVESEKEMLLDLARAVPRGHRLPGALRGLAVLDALARRSLERGGRPLMEGRGAALIATRAAIFGR